MVSINVYIQVLIFSRICLSSIHRRCYAKCIEGDSFHFYVLREQAASEAAEGSSISTKESIIKVYA